MRRRAILVATALALAVPALAVAGDPGPGDPVDPPLTPKPMAPASSSSSSATATKAAVTVVASTPLRVRGTGFRAHELVRLTVKTAKGSVGRQVRAGAKGGFALTFATIRFSRCAAPVPTIFARAGSSGRVTALVASPECPMQ
jgi:hypothetical protein